MVARPSRTTAFAIVGPIALEDLPGLCRRVCRLLSTGAADLVLCDVRDVMPDAVTVDALCRLQLAARRHGRRVRLRNASAELRELVELMGLRDVLPSALGCPEPGAAHASSADHGAEVRE